jgi:hypothetical protein
MRVNLTTSTGATDYWRFAWTKQKTHEIRQERTARDRVIEVVCSGKGPSEIYYPLEDSPAISRKFSGARTSDDVISFANDYGLLGLSSMRGQIESEMNMEPVCEWLFRAEQLRRMYFVWDLFDSSNKKELTKVIKWSKDSDSVRAEFSKRVIYPIANWHENRSWLSRWKPGDVLGPAKLLMVQEFNNRMERMASPLLLIDAFGEIKPYNSPSNLLAAMWLEFGQIISGARKQTTCESCGKWMDITENRSHKRKHAKCALREKMARYRNRLKEKRT